MTSKMADNMFKLKIYPKSVVFVFVASETVKLDVNRLMTSFKFTID